MDNPLDNPPQSTLNSQSHLEEKQLLNPNCTWFKRDPLKFVLCCMHREQFNPRLISVTAELATSSLMRRVNTRANLTAGGIQIMKLNIDHHASCHPSGPGIASNYKLDLIFDVRGFSVSCRARLLEMFLSLSDGALMDLVKTVKSISLQIF